MDSIGSQNDIPVFEPLDIYSLRLNKDDIWNIKIWKLIKQKDKLFQCSYYQIQFWKETIKITNNHRNNCLGQTKSQVRFIIIRDLIQLKNYFKTSFLIHLSQMLPGK